VYEFNIHAAWKRYNFPSHTFFFLFFILPFFIFIYITPRYHSDPYKRTLGDVSVNKTGINQSHLATRSPKTEYLYFVSWAWTMITVSNRVLNLSYRWAVAASSCFRSQCTRTRAVGSRHVYVVNIRVSRPPPPSSELMNEFSWNLLWTSYCWSYPM
jgi:hypothetical protein